MSRFGSALLLALALAEATAHAETRDPLAAEALFDEARGLMQAGRYEEACPKLEASQRLDPGVGTLLNLGDCYEHVGRTASAWLRFREAASAAVSAGQTEREQIARERALALEGKIAKLVVRPPARPADSLQIARDGSPIDPALWGQAIPVDPGPHEIEASAPHKKPWRTTIEVTPNAVEVAVPDLEDEPLSPSPLPRKEGSRFGAQRTASVSAAALGVIALGVGAGFALSARGTWADAKSHCQSNGCDPDGVRLGQDAGKSADVATALAIGGGVALAAAVVLWITSRP
jgi:serine/threonine-protein kinase